MGGDSSKVRITGPLAPYAAAFLAELEARGYRPNSACDQLRLLAQVSHWLEEHGLGARDLTGERVGEFLAKRRASGCAQWNSIRGLTPLLDHLRLLGVIPESTPSPSTPLEESLGTFRRYLMEERGLAPTTTTSYLGVARLFLAEHLDLIDGRLDELTTSDVLGFLGEQCHGRGAANVACGLRAFLRYCHHRGLGGPLADAVPSVASRRGSSLPHMLSAEQVRSLLISCERNTTLGARDFAVLTLLTRFGLRAGEVAALELSDIDWRSGEIVVRGKGPRLDRLPLPVDVGEALAQWVRVRQRCSIANVFLGWRAPRQPLTSAGVSAIVRAACRRAGLVRVSAHRLRHAAASEMLRAGSNLPEIAQVLRHRSLTTTAIYAKVDLTTLSVVAQPWPAS